MNRRFIALGRIIRYGGKNFIRNAWLSVAATAVMVVALTIILLAIVLNVTARNAIEDLSKNLKASIYLKEGVTEQRRNALQAELQSNQIVDSVQYVSTDEAREKFTDSFANDDKLLEGLALAGSDTLPSSLEVSVIDLNRIEEIANVAKSPRHSDIVDSVTLGKTDAKRTIDRAASAQRFITIGSVIAATIFAVVSVLIIFNTIRMAIFTRGEEIRIMKLIGATPMFIRGPFLVEASLYGVIAGIIANAAVYSMVISIGSNLATQSEFAETYAFLTKTSTMFMFLFGAIAVGIFVGIFSSLLAMQKHLKLKRW